MEYGTMEQYWIWLSSVEGIGVKRFYQLISEYEDARNVWDNVGEDMRFLGEKTLGNLKKARTESYFYRLFSTLDRMDISAVTRLSDEYPSLLTSIYDPPPTLYVRGNYHLNDEKMFAIVGSRRATADGKRAAKDMAEKLSQEGVCVVSGLARGIDTNAHIGALKGSTRTIAVLGCGVDRIYPPENDKLAAEIIEKDGALISEYLPGTPPLPANFPARNRIISGMSRGVLIVEGAKGSGAMLTIDSATEQGRDVFAVPGSIYSPLSEMPNKLIIDGAQPVVSGWDILESFHWAQRPSGMPAKEKVLDLDEDQKLVVEPLKFEELSFDELVQRTKFPAPKLNSLLTTLQLRGIIVKVPGGLYRAYV